MELEMCFFFLLNIIFTLPFRRAAQGLMEKMQGLQTYQTHDQSVEQQEQFSHAAEFMASRDPSDRQKKCATLSKAEWEATCESIIWWQQVTAVV